MSIDVRATGDPAWVLESAGPFLAADPVRHNVILTLLHNRVANPEPGRYWVVSADGEVAGVVFHSPLTFIATITPMPGEVLASTVDWLVEDGVGLPGVSGVADSAARFAGQWTERTRSAAAPTRGSRIYEATRLMEPRRTGGARRAARDADHEALVGWGEAFQAETGAGAEPVESMITRRTRSGELWIWEDQEIVSMAGVTPPVSGVCRIGPVYTPPELRGRGYASALVAAMAAAVRGRGERCMLYTDLANPISNAIYRAIGFESVDEVLEYRFA
ncbi:MAG: GNAT family N-acetyltransferase [Acidimicrobiales bacterium]